MQVFSRWLALAKQVVGLTAAASVPPVLVSHAGRVQACRAQRGAGGAHERAAGLYSKLHHSWSCGTPAAPHLGLMEPQPPGTCVFWALPTSRGQRAFPGPPWLRTKRTDSFPMVSVGRSERTMGAPLTGLGLRKDLENFCLHSMILRLFSTLVLQ